MKKTQESCIRGCANVEMINKSISAISMLDAELMHAVKSFNLMGNETRLKIIFIINSETNVCVCDLSDILGISISAISQQLRKLKDGKILQSKKVGQTIYYTIATTSKKRVNEALNQFKLQSTDPV